MTVGRIDLIIQNINFNQIQNPKGDMKKKLTVSLIAFSAFFGLNEASATIGYQSPGFGYRVGTAGAGSALPMDATDPTVNPGLIPFIPNQVFISAGIFSPHRFMDTSAAPAGNPAGLSHSRTNIFPDGSLGMRYGNDCNCWSFGLTLSGSGGLHTDYPNSRLNPAVLEGNKDYDHSIYYRIINLNITAAFRSMDGTFAIGISPIVSFSDFKTSSAVPGPTPFIFPETTGRNRWDNVWGIGGSIGVVTKLNPMLAFAFTARSPVFYQRFDKYRDLLISNFNSPAKFMAGLAFTPCEGSTFLFDYEFIYHTGTKLLRVNPEAGGFGWKNMNIFKVGYVQDIDCWTLRLGYSYGRSPIPADHVFANVLAPAIVEHHIAAGLSYHIDPCNTISLSGYYVPKKTLTDPGTGDIYSQGGKGTKIGMWQYDLQLAYQYNF